MRKRKWWEVAAVAVMIGLFIAGPRLHTPTHKTTAPPPRTPKIIALTFDDGPSPTYTPEILHLLSRYHAHATFFVLGSEVAQWPRIARSIIQQGSVIANHGYRHVNYFQVGVKGVWQDAERAQALLKKERIPMSPFYRPPYGNANPKLINFLSGKGYTVTLWSIDTRDWASPGTSVIIKKVLSHVVPGSIVLMHDGGGNRTQTVQALSAIVKVLSAEGYQFVTLPQYVQKLGLKAPPKLPRSESSASKSSSPQAQAGSSF